MWNKWRRVDADIKRGHRVSLCGETAKYHDLEAIIAMALDQSALLEMLDALRNADASDRIRQAADRHAGIVKLLDRKSVV